VSRPRRAVFITQHFDPGVELLATTVPQVTELARHVDEIVVIADGIDRSLLPPNGRAHSFRSRSKIGRGLRFAAALARELPGLRRGFVLAHMCPVYAVLAAPLVRPARVPLLLWYSHWHGHVVVRWAEKLVTRVVSVDRRSFPLESAKLFTTGQAIEGDAFECRPPRAGHAPLQLRAVGRYSESKGLDVIVRGFALALGRGVDARLDIHGPTSDDAARRCRSGLEALVADLGLGSRVGLHPEVPHDELPALLRDTDVLVNNAWGGADRIVYEAGASCVPALASNPSNFPPLGPELRFAADDPADLAARIEWIVRLGRGARDALGRSLRERVLADHSIQSWARRLVAAAGY
jgi:glycosyltransferase involved in cell wall biosynthesis